MRRCHQDDEGAEFKSLYVFLWRLSVKRFSIKALYAKAFCALAGDKRSSSFPSFLYTSALYAKVFWEI